MPKECNENKKLSNFSLGIFTKTIPQFFVVRQPSIIHEIGVVQHGRRRDQKLSRRNQFEELFCMTVVDHVIRFAMDHEHRTAHFPDQVAVRIPFWWQRILVGSACFTILALGTSLQFARVKWYTVSPLLHIGQEHLVSFPSHGLSSPTCSFEFHLKVLSVSLDFCSKLEKNTHIPTLPAV